MAKEYPELAGRMLTKIEKIRKENRARSKEIFENVANQVMEDKRMDKAKKDAFINQLRSLGYLR